MASVRHTPPHAVFYAAVPEYHADAALSSHRGLQSAGSPRLLAWCLKADESALAELFLVPGLSSAQLS